MSDSSSGVRLHPILFKWSVLTTRNWMGRRSPQKHWSFSQTELINRKNRELWGNSLLAPDPWEPLTTQRKKGFKWGVWTLFISIVCINHKWGGGGGGGEHCDGNWPIFVLFVVVGEELSKTQIVQPIKKENGSPVHYIYRNWRRETLSHTTHEICPIKLRPDPNIRSLEV